MLARALSATPWGVDARPVQVEVDVRNGLPQMQIVGLAHAAVRESRERVRAAVKNCGFELPPRAVVINLAPADLPKGGNHLDLAIAVALLAAYGHLPEAALAERMLCGELGLDGAVRPVRGALAVADLAQRRAAAEVVVPAANAAEAAALGGPRVAGVASLAEAIGHLTGEAPLPPATADAWTDPPPGAGLGPAPDLAEVRGQEVAKRALEVAAAGGHNLLRLWPDPGYGPGSPRRCSPPALRSLDSGPGGERAAGDGGGGGVNRGPAVDGRHAAVTQPDDRAEDREPVQITKALRRFVDEGLAVQFEDARSAGSLGFLTRLTALTNLPYRQIPDSRFTRHNGPYVLHIQALPDIGLPYGRYPRLLLAWITTEAVRTRSRCLDLGNSLSAFMSQVGVSPHGGAHGPLGRFQNQLARLLATTFQFYKIQRGRNLHYTRGKGFVITDDSELWWEPRRLSSDSRPLLDCELPAARRSRSAPWGARLVISERFFEEILEHRIPVNLRALGALQAPLAMDLYVWLTYRLHALSKPVTVPWRDLHLQCGSQTPRIPVFRFQVLQKLRSILTVYPEARVQEADDQSGLVLKPSPPHIPRIHYHLPSKASGGSGR